MRNLESGRDFYFYIGETKESKELIILVNEEPEKGYYPEYVF
jgi:hypothetical protein